MCGVLGLSLATLSRAGNLEGLRDYIAGPTPLALLSPPAWLPRMCFSLGLWELEPA